MRRTSGNVSGLAPLCPQGFLPSPGDHPDDMHGRRRDRLHGHVLRQAPCLLTGVSHHRLFHTRGDLLLRPQRGPHQSMQPWPLSTEAHQAHPARIDCAKHHMSSPHHAVEGRETGHALNKRPH